jgi:hypothetical protein
MAEGDVRVGDAERDDALRLLAEHLSAGRLTLAEHDERSSRILAAKTWGDLIAEFSDLPAPQPSRPNSAPQTRAADLPPVEPEHDAGAVQRRHAGLRFAGAITPVVWLVTIAAVAATGLGWLIFLPIAYSVLLAAVWRTVQDERRRGR